MINNDTNQKDWTVWLRHQQRLIVRILLTFTLILGFIGLVISIVRVLVEKGGHFNLVYYAISYFAIAVLFSIKRIPDNWRAICFAAILYAFGVLAIYSGWLAGGGRTFLLALIVVSAVLISPRAGIVTAIISFFTYIIFGLAFHQGWVKLMTLPDPASTSPIIIEGIGFAMAIGMVILGLWFFGKALMAANQANQDLQSSQASFHSIVERNTDCVIVVDQEGVIRFANRAAETLLAKEWGQVVGQIAKFPLGVGIPIELFLKADENKNRVMELRVDETTWNEAPAFLAIFRDITERKLAEKRLKASEAQTRALLDAIPDMIFVFDSHGTYLQSIPSKDVQPILPPEQLLGVNISQVMPANVVKQAMQAIEASLQTGAVQSIEYQLAGGQGVEDFEARIVASNHDTVLAIVRNITEKKRFENRLALSEKKYREFVEQSSEGIWLLEFDDAIPVSLPPEEQVQRIQQAGYIGECNLACVKMYGYEERDDILGKRLLDLYGSPEAAEENFQVTLQLVRGGYRGNNRETVEMDRYGKKVYFLNNAAGIIQNGHLVGIWGTQRDNTSLKLAELEREALIRELSAKNAELERFTYTVSHDLKSPLVTIRGFAGYLEQDARSGNVERLKNDVERISRAAVRMQRLLDELLELSRIGRLINPPESVPFDEVVQEAIGLVEGRITATQAEILVQADLPNVFGDRIRLVEVVQNLLDNAVKFMGKQEHPRVEIGSKELESGELALFIRDNGIGIDPQYHDRIFRLFDKLEPGTEGTGVGLALVKRIVDIHNGKIWVESKGAGCGTTFYFTLPMPASGG